MKQIPRIALLSLLISMSHGATAVQRIAILDFELNDITSLPGTPAELRRTAAMAPLLRERIAGIGGYEIVPVDATVLGSANAGFGYLFRFHDLAAKLGRQLGADWIVVSQHSKPSFLYSYLMTHLVDVDKQSLSASFDIELKGNHETVTRRGIDSLANKIHATIIKRRGDASAKPDG